MEDKTQVPRELAEQEFERILRAARCKWNLYCMQEGKNADLDRETIIDAIMDGVLSVNDEGFPTLHAVSNDGEEKKIFMRRMIDSDLLAMDRVKDGQVQAKMNAAIGKWVGLAPSIIGTLDRKDKGLLEVLWGIFL